MKLLRILVRILKTIAAAPSAKLDYSFLAYICIFVCVSAYDCVGICVCIVYE